MMKLPSAEFDACTNTVLYSLSVCSKALYSSIMIMCFYVVNYAQAFAGFFNKLIRRIRPENITKFAHVKFPVRARSTQGWQHNNLYSKTVVQAKGMATHEPISNYAAYGGADPTSPRAILTADEPPSYEPPPGKSPLDSLTADDLPLRSPVGEVHRRLSIDEESEGSSIDDNLSVASITSSIEDQLTWRGRMQVALHSHYLHLVIIVLVVLDALIVLFELLLDIGALNNIRCTGEGFLEQARFCHYEFATDESSELHDVCLPTAVLVLQRANLTPLEEGSFGEEPFCTCKFREGKRVCLDDRASTGVNPALVLHGTSIAILTIFMFEVALKLFAFRLKYFTHKFEVFDGIVVVISWTLDVASLKEEEAFEAIALLIILRLWRVVRIVNGAVLSAKARSDEQLHEARNHARKIIHAYHKAQDHLSNSEQENGELRQLLKDHGVSAPEKKNSKSSSYKNPLSDPLREE